jgi:hypothetical protein
VAGTGAGIIDGREWLKVVAWKALLGRTDHDLVQRYVESHPYSIEDDRYAGVRFL